MREKGRYKNVNKKCDKNELKHKYEFTRFVRLRKTTALRITPQEISRRHRELRLIVVCVLFFRGVVKKCEIYK